MKVNLVKADNALVLVGTRSQCTSVRRLYRHALNGDCASKDVVSTIEISAIISPTRIVHWRQIYGALSGLVYLSTCTE